MIHSVTDLNFKERVLASSLPVLVNFEAPWCGLCKLIQPTLIQFYDRWDEQIKLVNINADENFKLASTYKLKTLPTLILFTNGRIVDRLEGFHSKEALRADLDRMTRKATLNWQIGEKAMPMQIDWRLVRTE
ncbi:thioredoxin family protein [Chamaesiphon polymorphus]|jgi:thioredoxin 1|uniref:Thiol reductase thioredoxin n=1 Tax=Chamaesiphon polymorphus CCALA 037 TaxID=2107692 RepID=A0A2T1GJH0_9CYAN|nr:thioredoxin domain-containing protein [Chamaesiphon polymorphus]PSB57931.1 thiol reductase thioredoxin [Chamaesiphon polymorphus CCALA 037]